MSNYFSKCSTVEEVKSLYRTLAKQHHPDLGGDTATMQEINSQYHATPQPHERADAHRWRQGIHLHVQSAA
jgi:DnaJ-class molecular chaperone